MCGDMTVVVCSGESLEAVVATSDWNVEGETHDASEVGVGVADVCGNVNGGRGSGVGKLA